MSKLLSDLLGAAEPMFSLAIKQLEADSGNPSADIRLTAEITGKVYLKTQELGLDPDDTTGRELYHALLNLIEKQDEHLVNSCNTLILSRTLFWSNPPATPGVNCGKVSEIANNSSAARSA